MIITARTQGFELTRAIDEFARDHVRAALARIDEDVIAVDIYMKDANGPRGGFDKQVLICTRMRNRQQVALLTTHDDLYAAIIKGVKRTKRAVRRQMRRSRRFEKQRLRDLLHDDSLASASRN